MNKGFFTKIKYKYFFWVARVWYQMTVKLSKVPNVKMNTYDYAYKIVMALNWGNSWKRDPLMGFWDIMPHPTKVQDKINKKILIDDCDGHAVYWATNLINSKIATKAWIATLHMQKQSGEISGHCICVYQNSTGKYFWCDYSMPRHFESFENFGWVDQLCGNIKAKPIAAGLFEITSIKSDYTPIFSKKTITKIYQ